MAGTGHSRNRDMGPLGLLVLKAHSPRGGHAARPTRGFWVFRLWHGCRCSATRSQEWRESSVDPGGVGRWPH